TPLKLDLTSDLLPGDHRSFAFAPEGLALLAEARSSGYFLRLTPEISLDAADLQRLAQPLSFGAKWIWRLHPESASISATAVPRYDSSTWPVPEASGKLPEQSTRRCANRSGPFAAYAQTSSYRPDPNLEMLWLESSKALSPKNSSPGTVPPTLEARPAPGFVMGFRDSWVRRLETGRLMLVKGQTQKQIASSRCGARIVHFDPETQTFLISCEEYRPVVPKRRKGDKHQAPRYRFDLNLVRPGFVRALQIEIARTGTDAKG